MQGGYPFIGHGLSQFKNPCGGDHLRFFKDVPNDGITHYRGFFNSDQLLLTSPKAPAEVLVSRPYNFKKPEKGRRFLCRVLSDGLVVVEGDAHKYQRKHILPSFSFRHIKGLYPTFWSKSVSLTRSIGAEVFENHAGPNIHSMPSGVTDLNYWATKVTLDLIGMAGLGRDFNTLKNSDDKLVKNYEEITTPSLEIAVLFAATIIGPQ
jgi:cytochrome P450